MKHGKLYVHSPYGRESYKVLILYDLFGFYRIQALGFTRLAGIDRSLAPGERAWVPGHAIRILDEDHDTNTE